VFQRDNGGLDARGDVELAQDVLDMDLDRGLGDASSRPISLLLAPRAMPTGTEPPAPPKRILDRWKGGVRRVTIPTPAF